VNGPRSTESLLPEQRPRSKRQTRRAQPYRRKGTRPNGPTLSAMLRGAAFGMANPMDHKRQMQKRRGR
jgi:hypothetical protein